LSERAKKGSVIQIQSKTFPLDQGWQRYVFAGNNKTGLHAGHFGVAFGKTFDDDGFRYPSSQDSLQAPWEYLVLRANPKVEINVYFMTEMSDGSFIKLYVNSRQDSIGFSGVPVDEFQIAVPAGGRPDLLLIDTRSFVPRMNGEPRAVKGFRVRGPTELSLIGTFDSRSSIPSKLMKGTLNIRLP
jgi:hypothetical protein